MSFESKLAAVVRTALRPGHATVDRVEFKNSGNGVICLINGFGSSGRTPSAALSNAIDSWNRRLAGHETPKRKTKSASKKRVTSRRKRRS